MADGRICRSLYSTREKLPDDSVWVRSSDASDDVHVIQPQNTFSTCATTPRKTLVYLIHPDSQIRLLFPGGRVVSLESARIEQTGLRKLISLPRPTLCYFALTASQQLFGRALPALSLCPTIYSGATGKTALSLQGSLPARANFGIALWSLWQWSLRFFEPKSGDDANRRSAALCVCSMCMCTGMCVGIATDSGMGGGRASRILSVACLSRMSGDSHDSALQTTFALQLACCVCSQLSLKCIARLEIVPP